MREKALQEIIDHLKTDNAAWFEGQRIIVKEKGDYWVLNYHQFTPEKTVYNTVTRGLVIHKSGKIASAPFFRFFNYGEPTAAQVDFSNSDVLEKLDGSLVGVFFPEGDLENPVWHFRSLISAHQKDKDFAIKGFVHSEEVPLLMEVEPYLKEVNFKKAVGYDVKNFCFMFEFISRANAVITKYEEHQYGLYLTGARHIPSLYELDEDALDALARVMEVRRPRRWNADSYEEVVAMMAGFSEDYEGFVIRDRATGERIKIKSEDYLKRHRLLTKLSYRNLIPLYLDGEQGEIEAYFPQTKQIFNEIETCYNKHVNEALYYLRLCQGREEFLQEVCGALQGYGDGSFTREGFLSQFCAAVNRWEQRRDKKEIARRLGKPIFTTPRWARRLKKEEVETSSEVPEYIQSTVLALIDEVGDLEEKVRKHIASMSPDTLIEMWGLKEELVEEAVGDIVASGEMIA